MQFIILGCGSSMGVPRPDGFFGNCDPSNKKNYRTRCSALLKTTDENILDYRVAINNGAEAGQTVFHLHLHILAGRIFGWPPG